MSTPAPFRLTLYHSTKEIPSKATIPYPNCKIPNMQTFFLHTSHVQFTLFISKLILSEDFHAFMKQNKFRIFAPSIYLICQFSSPHNIPFSDDTRPYYLGDFGDLLITLIQHTTTFLFLFTHLQFTQIPYESTLPIRNKGFNILIIITKNKAQH